MLLALRSHSVRTAHFACRQGAFCTAGRVQALGSCNVQGCDHLIQLSRDMQVLHLLYCEETAALRAGKMHLCIGHRRFVFLSCVRDTSRATASSMTIMQ
jgi:hypothetical protein